MINHYAVTAPTAIQLLKASGFNPIITTASKHNEEYCLAAGATHVIDYNAVPYAELGAAVKKITSLPIPVIYDAVGWPDVQRALWEILAPQGKLATVFRAVVGEDGKASENDDGKVVVGVYGSANAPFNYEFGKKMFPGVTKLLESGDLKVSCSFNRRWIGTDRKDSLSIAEPL